jgi:hypothetical protein
LLILSAMVYLYRVVVGDRAFESLKGDLIVLQFKPNIG